MTSLNERTVEDEETKTFTDPMPLLDCFPVSTFSRSARSRDTPVRCRSFSYCNRRNDRPDRAGHHCWCSTNRILSADSFDRDCRDRCDHRYVEWPLEETRDRRWMQCSHAYCWCHARRTESWCSSFSRCRGNGTGGTVRSSLRDFDRYSCSAEYSYESDRDWPEWWRSKAEEFVRVHSSLHTSVHNGWSTTKWRPQ